MTLEERVDAYCAAWAEADDAARTARLGAVLSDDVTYTDPRSDVAGLEAFSAHIGTVLAARPGSRVERLTAIEEHHGLARFGWHAVAADGAEVIGGIDVIELAEHGPITRIIGFFGTLAAKSPD